MGLCSHLEYLGSLCEQIFFVQDLEFLVFARRLVRLEVLLGQRDALLHPRVQYVRDQRADNLVRPAVTAKLHHELLCLLDLLRVQPRTGEDPDQEHSHQYEVHDHELDLQWVGLPDLSCLLLSQPVIGEGQTQVFHLEKIVLRKRLFWPK